MIAYKLPVTSIKEQPSEDAEHPGQDKKILTSSQKVPSFPMQELTNRENYVW